MPGTDEPAPSDPPQAPDGPDVSDAALRRLPGPRAPWRTARTLAWAAVTLALAGALGGMLAAEAGDASWLLEAAGAFRVQQFWVFVVAAIAFGLGRRWIRLSLAASSALVALLSFGGVWFGGPPASDGPRRRAALINVQASNRRVADVLGWIRSTDPDFVVVLEVNAFWSEAIAELSDSRPHVVMDVHDEDRFGIALLSRHPLRDARLLSLCGGCPPTVIATAELPEGPLHLIGAHPIPPVGQPMIEMRNAQMDGMGDLARALDGPALLLGDLNATPWSPAFRRLVARSGLRDSREGFGIQASWPAQSFVFRVPLDHALVSPGVAVHRRELGPEVGSDHLGILVEVSLPPPGRAAVSRPAHP